MSLPQARKAVAEQIGSSPDCHRSFRRSTVVALTAAILTTFGLTACGNGGFKPLYGSASLGGGNVEQKLAEVKIAPIPGRVGQVIRNELIFETTGGGHAVPPTHRLEVATRETVSSTIVDRTGESQSYVYNLDASFRLIRLTDNTVVLKGKSYGRAGFERFESIYSNVRARKNAEDRAAKTVGGELKTRLASFLATT